MNKEYYEERTCTTCSNVFSLTITATGDVITEAPEVCGKNINFNSEVCWEKSFVGRTYNMEN